MAAIRPDDAYREAARARLLAQYEERLEARRERLQRTLQDMAGIGANSPLFAHLRASLAEADPKFKARMDAMSGEETP